MKNSPHSMENRGGIKDRLRANLKYLLAYSVVTILAGVFGVKVERLSDKVETNSELIIESELSLQNELIEISGGGGKAIVATPVFDPPQEPESVVKKKPLHHIGRKLFGNKEK